MVRGLFQPYTLGVSADFWLNLYTWKIHISMGCTKSSLGTLGCTYSNSAVVPEVLTELVASPFLTRDSDPRLAK